MNGSVMNVVCYEQVCLEREPNETAGNFILNLINYFDFFMFTEVMRCIKHNSFV